SCRARRLALSAHRGRPGAGAHGEGHEILQGRRLELSAPAQSEDREAPETMTASGGFTSMEHRALPLYASDGDEPMASPTKLALTVLGPSMLVLSGCADLALQDT